MRSLLFAPGGSAKMMAKAATGDADAVIFDLEDAVHPRQLPAADRGFTSGSIRSTVHGAVAISMRSCHCARMASCCRS
jgi:citrate lyase beta subunit